MLDKQRRLDNQGKKLAKQVQIEEENKSLKQQLESKKAEVEKLRGKTGLGEGQAQQIMDLKGEIRVLEAKLRNYIRKYGELS